MSESPVKFRLKKGYNRTQISVQELLDDVVIADGEIYETTDNAVIRELDENIAVERAPHAKEKGGEPE